MVHLMHTEIVLYSDYNTFALRLSAPLLRASGLRESADAAYQRAIGLEPDPAVPEFLQRRRKVEL